MAFRDARPNAHQHSRVRDRPAGGNVGSEDVQLARRRLSGRHGVYVRGLSYRSRRLDRAGVGLALGVLVIQARSGVATRS